MSDVFWIIACLVIWSIGWIGIDGYQSKWKSIENQAIEKGYAEIRVVNGERKFQWK